MHILHLHPKREARRDLIAPINFRKPLRFGPFGAGSGDSTARVFEIITFRPFDICFSFKGIVFGARAMAGAQTAESVP
jgi:hypothetical protein